MVFAKLASLDVSDGSVVRTISVYHGDLTAIPADHAVDMLVISAFPNDYTPLQGSLIGALQDAGLSVARIAVDKEYDLRATSSFWLSRSLRPVFGHLNIDRIACFETAFGGQATELVGDLFRGLFPFVDGDDDIDVALPLLNTGMQRRKPEEMFDAIVHAASHWMARGLNIGELKIVIHHPDLAQQMAARLNQATAPAVAPPGSAAKQFDVFLSFSSADADVAEPLKTALQRRQDVGTVFDYRFAIDKGVSWQTEIDKAITSCRAIVAVISPTYIASAECQEELLQARLRHKREGGSVLFPVYWRKWEGDLALWLQLINAADCREADRIKLDASIDLFGFRPAATQGP